MSFELRLTPSAEKQIASLSFRDKERVVRALLAIELDPYIGKKLKGRFEGAYSSRVWPFRIIYKIYKNQCIVLIINVSQRKDAYR